VDCVAPLADSNIQLKFLVPLVNVEVLRQVCCQAGCRGRPTKRLQVEVVRPGSPHAEILEIEAVQPKAYISPILRIGVRGLQLTTPMSKG